MNLEEKLEIEQFEDEMWRARHQSGLGRFGTIFVTLWIAYVAAAFYLPISCGFGWWPW